jgi:hypothetical protein
VPQRVRLQLIKPATSSLHRKNTIVIGACATYTD